MKKKVSRILPPLNIFVYWVCYIRIQFSYVYIFTAVDNYEIIFKILSHTIFTAGKS